MRFVRRASLVFSLVLIVAIVVGYVARTSELSSERNLSLTTASELGAARLSAIVDATSIVARSADDPASAAAAFASTHRNLGVCVVSAATIECAGEGPTPNQNELELERARRNAGVAGSSESGVTIVTIYDSLMAVVATGDDVTVFANAPDDVMSIRTEHSVWATTLLPADLAVGGFAVDQGLRQTSTPVEGAGGVFVIASGDDEVSLPADEQRFYTIIFGLAAVLMMLAGITMFVEQRNLLERASFDPLTRLPNRGEFERRASDLIGVAERNESGLCLLLFDLNGFKKVNDTHGHAAGDEMLRVVGARLRQAVRDGDVVARWGGDEFVVVMPGVSTEEMGSRRALQLAEQISGRTRIEGVVEPLRVKVSVGVAVWPIHGTDLDSLVIASDQAMYEAKRAGTICRVAEPVKPEASLMPTHL